MFSIRLWIFFHPESFINNKNQLQKHIDNNFGTRANFIHLKSKRNEENYFACVHVQLRFRDYRY